MRAVAFAPGHISGIFEPIYNIENPFKTGSRGAGINVSLGAISDVKVEDFRKQVFEIYVNNKKTEFPVVSLALKGLIGEKKIRIVIKINLELPISQGFGMSAASAVSASYALAEIIGVAQIEAMKASHLAEVKLKTGLGDVIACCFGGIEIRNKPGIPPWGFIEHIPGKYDLVLCIVGNKMDTKTILSDSKKIDVITKCGNYCVNKLLENPSLENFFLLSQLFIKKTNLAEKRVLKAIEISNRYGMASMCMLGNSIFAIGETDKLYEKLARFGKVFICKVDEYGARVIKE